jgi:hypothetical protein
LISGQSVLFSYIFYYNQPATLHGHDTVYSPASWIGAESGLHAEQVLGFFIWYNFLLAGLLLPVTAFS